MQRKARRGGSHKRRLAILISKEARQTKIELRRDKKKDKKKKDGS